MNMLQARNNKTSTSARFETPPHSFQLNCTVKQRGHPSKKKQKTLNQTFNATSRQGAVWITL